MFDTTEWDTAVVSADPLQRMKADLAEAAGEDRTEWNADSLSSQLIDLIELRERIDAETAAVAALWQRKRAWEVDGSLSPVAWLTRRAPIAPPDARLLVKTAKVVERCPELGDALAEGRTTTVHVGALARVMSPQREPLLVDHEEVMTKQAERLSIKDFTLLARRWAAIADDHLAADNHNEHRPRNEVHAAITMDGWLDARLRLDPIAGATFLKVLDHIAPPDPANAPDGVRSLSQRRGDALAELAGWYHRCAKPGANPPNLDVVVDIATLNGNTPELAQVRRDLEGIGPITQATLQQIGCSATLSRVVMAGKSVILDMGRETRFATPSQARAIRIRDGGCIFPSCDRPAPWCDIHHVNEFGKGGLTDVACMVCLCTRHHTLIHNSKWTIVINPDGTFKVTHPTRAP